MLFGGGILHLMLYPLQAKHVSLSSYTTHHWLILVVELLHVSATLRMNPQVKPYSILASPTPRDVRTQLGRRLYRTAMAAQRILRIPLLVQSLRQTPGTMMRALESTLELYHWGLPSDGRRQAQLPRRRHGRFQLSWEQGNRSAFIRQLQSCSGSLYVTQSALTAVVLYNRTTGAMPVGKL
jgi:hypothetical protein